MKHSSYAFSHSNAIDSGNFKLKRDQRFSDLRLEWWERDDDCLQAKKEHMDKIDHQFGFPREDLVLLTTLSEDDIALEPNMFPYLTPLGIEHYTLWSKYDLSHDEIVDWVDSWLAKNMPQVCRWQYDDNMGERSFNIFHVHVFIETTPFSFYPKPQCEYFPPHLQMQLEMDISEKYNKSHANLNY